MLDTNLLSGSFMCIVKIAWTHLGADADESCFDATADLVAPAPGILLPQQDGRRDENPIKPQRARASTNWTKFRPVPCGIIAVLDAGTSTIRAPISCLAPCDE